MEMLLRGMFLELLDFFSKNPQLLSMYDKSKTDAIARSISSNDSHPSPNSIASLRVVCSIKVDNFIIKSNIFN